MSLDREKIYYSVLVIASLASVAFWTSFSLQQYRNFQDGFSDIGAQLQNLYVTINHPEIVQGLQLLVFMNHIAPDELIFITPLFSFWESPTTLFLLQAVVLSFTSILIFFVANDLTGEKDLSFVLGLAYLMNPGMQGMLYYDFHEEFLIIPFVLLVFYFYMKVNRKLFYVSLFLLLAVMDSAVFVAGALGAGLLFYEFVHDKDERKRKERIRLGVSIVVGSIIALIFYITYSSTLIAQYSTNYQNLSPYLRVQSIDADALFISEPSNLSPSAAFYTMSGSPVRVMSSLNSSTVQLILLDVIFGVLVFGIATLVDPALTAVLAAPWLIQIIVLRDLHYGSINFQYYSYVIGGSIVAAILGILIMRERKKHKLLGMNWRGAMLKSILTLSWTAFLLGVIVRPPMSSPVTTNCPLQLNSLITKIPQNVSLLTTAYVAPHVSEITNLEVASAILFYPILYYFKPTYILNPGGCVPFFIVNGVSEVQYLKNYTSEMGYALVVQEGNVTLWKLQTG